MNSRLAEPEIDYVLRDSGAQVLLAAEPFIDIARRVSADLGIRLIDAADVPTAAPIRWRGPIGPHAEVDARSGRLVPCAESDDAAPETAVDDRVAMIAYTSGTTGFPKGSINTNAGILSRLLHWSWSFGLSHREVVSTPGPMFHLSYGGLTLAQLVAGGRTRVMTAFEPEAALSEYRDHTPGSIVKVVDPETCEEVPTRRSLGRTSCRSDRAPCRRTARPCCGHCVRAGALGPLQVPTRSDRSRRTPPQRHGQGAQAAARTAVLLSEANSARAVVAA